MTVASTSIAVHRTIGALMADQESKVLMVMEPGYSYTRRELGVLAGIENSAAARTVNGLVKSEALLEIGTKVCRHSGYRVGAVTLSLAL